MKISDVHTGGVSSEVRCSTVHCTALPCGAWYRSRIAAGSARTDDKVHVDNNVEQKPELPWSRVVVEADAVGHRDRHVEQREDLRGVPLPAWSARAHSWAAVGGGGALQCNRQQVSSCVVLCRGNRFTVLLCRGRAFEVRTPAR